MRIDVRIERLVIDGGAHDGDAVRAALERGLAQLLSASPPGLAGVSVPMLRAQAPRTPMQTAESLGAGVAQALHGALAPPPGGAP